MSVEHREAHREATVDVTGSFVKLFRFDWFNLFTLNYHCI